MVLAAFQSGAYASDVEYQAAPVHPEMANEVLRQDQVRVPVGLEVRVVTAPVMVDLVLV